MPVIVPGNSKLQDLKGIHLWHAGMSSCSQRVRLALAELDLPYESHIIDLHHGENASQDYQQIHPQGLVPALVHDGTLIIDSVDIIDYLDTALGRNRLAPTHLSEEISGLLTSADAAQPSLKVCTFEFLFGAVPPADPDVLMKFQATHKNEKLKAFHREFQAGFARSRVTEAVDYTVAEFAKLEHLLDDGRQWLAGDTFSLADIAWMPNFHRFDLLAWPYDRYPGLSGWFSRASSRSSYKTALQDWEPRTLLETALPLIAARKSEGSGIDTYGMLATNGS